MKKVKKNKGTVESATNEDTLAPYAERIAELKTLNNDLAEMLEEYRRREKAIADTLAYVERIKDETEKELALRFSLECERLCAFKKKWLSAVKYGAVREDYEHTVRVLDECRVLLMSEFESQQSCDYLEESARLGEKIAVSEKKEIEKLTDKDLQDLLDQL